MSESGGDGPRAGAPPLDGLRVVDLSTVLAGPSCARYLGDFGADVIKVERPDGDGLRRMGARDPESGDSLFWRYVGRNKRTVELDLRDPADAEVLRGLLRHADVLVENLRPGKLEALGFDPDALIAANPRLVITRVTGFGQDGPYAGRPGFATIAEALSGFAAINGEPDGQPLLPPIALTDEITALAGAFATMVAVHGGGGQSVDVNLLESMVQVMGPLLSTWLVHGEQQQRLGSGIPYTVPRGTWRTADDRWVAVSTSAESVAQRVMGLLGVAEDERFATFEGRTAHRAEVDELMTAWIGARTLVEVLAGFDAVEAACAPVYDTADLAADPHVAARGVVQHVDGVPMPGLVARLSRTPGVLRWAGRPVGADTEQARSSGDAWPDASLD
jgi:crotonobetainyl-CoA:carnitine CoA-transferase CaiB-like acyl-CoA transferase